jgi:hypothetical protein
VLPRERCAASGVFRLFRWGVGICEKGQWERFNNDEMVFVMHSSPSRGGSHVFSNLLQPRKKPGLLA